MHNTCVTIRTRWSVPYSSSTDYTICSNERYPFAYSSSRTTPCFCSCCSTSNYRAPLIPNYCYGYGQSSLIQRPPCRNVCLGGYDRLYYPRLPVCDVDRRCCVDKAVNFREKGVGGRGRRRGLRKVVVFEDIDGSYDLGDVDEADILLSLLADDTDEDCLYVKRESKRLVKKPMVEKRENGGSCRECGSKKKRVDLGFSENYDDSREYESVVPSSRNRRRVEITQMKEDGEALARKENRKTRINEEKREAIVRKEYQRSKEKQEQESLLRKENWKARAREEEEEALVRKENRKTRIREEKREAATLRKANQRSEEKQEQESLLRKENWKARAREEEREEFFRSEEHRPKVTRAGSNSSSYYSVASTAGYESDDDIVLRDERYAGGESSSGYKDNSRSNEIVYHEAVEEDRRHEVDRVGHEVSLARNRTAQESHTSSSVMESDFRKKSEKKLTDVSLEEIESRIGIRQKESDHSMAHGSGYGKSSNSYMNVDDRKFKSTGSASVDVAKHLHSQTGEEVLRQSETGMKYKQLVEIPDDDRRDMKTSYGSKNMYSGKDSMSAKEISSSQVAGKKHQTVVGLTIRDDESKKNLQEVSEVSNIVDVDVRRTAVLQKKFEISDKKREDYSTNVLSSLFDAKKKQRYDKVTEQYQQLTKKESTSVSEKQSDTKLVKQEENVNLVYGSSQRSEDRYSQSHSNHTRREDSRNESMKLTNISITQSGHSSEIVVDEQNKTNLETLVRPPYSHSGAKGAHHDESTSGSTIATVNNESLQTSKLHEHHLERSTAMHQEEYGGGQSNAGQTLMLTAHEDALGSAARFQNSSAQYVGEFVDQVRHETMSSEAQREKKTYESQLLHEEKNDQRRLSQYSSGDSSSKEQDVRHVSQASGVKGPSDEVWKVDEPPVQETSGDEKNAGNVIAKRTGRSLWNVMADVFRLRWSSQSESHSASGKKSGRSSPNQSTSSETWFSGHEAEENKENTEEKEKKSITQEQKIQSQFKESSCSSTSEGHLEQVGINAPSTSEIMESGLHSSEETSESNLAGTSNTAPISRPALRLQRSPIVRSTLETGDENASGSSMSEQLNNESMEQSELAVTQGGRKGRILQRKDQMIKDNFDEWEEAVRLETEQRKMDEMFMREALVEARKAAESWEVPVGAVLVHKGKIIARGWNLVEETRDSTAHAEMICIREASKILRTWRLSDTTLYVTLEPCPMCAGAILQARVDCVVWGAPNKLLGADGSWIRLFPSGDGGNALEQTDKPTAPVHPFHPKITIRRNVLASECADAMQQFFQLRRKKKEKRSESPSPPSCLPIPHHQPKFLTKFQGALNILFTS